MTRIIQLETHNQQLKNIIKKELANNGAHDVVDDDDNSQQRKFDFVK